MYKKHYTTEIIEVLFIRKFGFNKIFDAMKRDWNFMIDRWDGLTVGGVHAGAGYSGFIFWIVGGSLYTDCSWIQILVWVLRPEKGNFHKAFGFIFSQ